MKRVGKIMETKIIYKNDKEEMEKLSHCVVKCFEIVDSFSISGKHIDIEQQIERMSKCEADKIWACYYRPLLKYSKRKFIKPSINKIIKILKPIHPFIVGIYRNGTPSYRFESMKADKNIDDKYLLKQFALAYRNTFFS